MDVLTIGLGGPPKGGSAGKPKSLAKSALMDFMKSKGEPMDEDEAPVEEEASAAEEAGLAAAEDFGNAKSAEERWDAFKRMQRACEESKYSEEPEVEEDASEEEA